MSETQSFHDVRAEILERDNYECRFCGMEREQHKEEHGRDLEVHHLVPRSIEEINEEENLITVCRSCHKTLEHTQGDLLKRVEGVAESKQESQDVDPGYFKHEISTLLTVGGSITVYVVHENEVITSNLKYVGTDKESAHEAFDECSNHATMETATVYFDDVVSTLNTDEVERKVNEEVLDGFEWALEHTDAEELQR